jgi:hypothetical protein
MCCFGKNVEECNACGLLICGDCGGHLTEEKEDVVQLWKEDNNETDNNDTFDKIYDISKKHKCPAGTLYRDETTYENICNLCKPTETEGHGGLKLDMIERKDLLGTGGQINTV